MNISSRLEEHIRSLENALLQPEVRRSSKAVNALIAQGFFEFASSGRIYNYTPGDTFDDESTYEIQDFKAQRLSRGCVLATYRAVKKDAANVVAITLRSSIWKCGKRTWKIVFHQGTVAGN